MDWPQTGMGRGLGPDWTESWIGPRLDWVVDWAQTGLVVDWTQTELVMGWSRD